MMDIWLDKVIWLLFEHHTTSKKNHIKILINLTWDFKTLVHVWWWCVIMRLLMLSRERERERHHDRCSSMSTDKGRMFQAILKVYWWPVLICLKHFSITALLIPFIAHNEANHALVGSTMQHQVVPKLERCIEGIGLEC